MDKPASKNFQPFFRIVILIFVIKIIIIGGMTLYLIDKHHTPQPKSPPQVCFQEKCFDLEIADTPTKRKIGLMERSTLEENRAMLFLFEQEDLHSFWMQDTLIPLDIVRLDQKDRVVEIQQAQPCTEQPCPLYTPSLPAYKALEFNQGTAQKIWLTTGDNILFSGFQS